MMHWTLLIRSHPGSTGNPVLEALRTATGALADEIEVSVFLLQDAVCLALDTPGETDTAWQIHHDLMEEIHELGGEVHAVGLEWLGEGPKALRTGVRHSNMAAMIRAMKQSDQVISF